MRLINKLRYCLVAAIPVVALAACSSGGSSSGVRAPGQRRRCRPSRSTWCRRRTRPGIYIAQDNGYFAQQGLKVTIEPINGGEYGMGDLQTGKAQLDRGELRLVHPRPDRGQVRGAQPDEPRPDGAVQAHRHADDRRLVADAGGQPGALRPAELAVQDGAAAREGARDGRRQHAAQHRVRAARLAARRGRLRGERAHAGARDPPDDARAARQAHDPRRVAARAVRHGGGAGVRRGAGWPTSTRARCRTSRSARSSAALRGCSRTRTRSPRSSAPTRRASRSRTPTAPRWSRRSSPTRASTTEIAATMTLDTYPLVMDVPVMQRVSDAMYEFGVISKPYKITEHDPAGDRRDRRVARRCSRRSATARFPHGTGPSRFARVTALPYLGHSLHQSQLSVISDSCQLPLTAA